MWITIDQILCLQAVKETGSITSASYKLKRAKSAIHYGLRRLEEQVGFRLVESGGYRVKLTSRGEQFLIKATPILKSMDKLKEDTHRIATGVEMKITISVSAVFSLKKFNKAIIELQKRYPDTEIAFYREILSGDRMLLGNLVDLAIFEHPIQDERYECKKIDSVEMPLWISSDHPFLKLAKEEQTSKNLFRYPQVIQRSTLPDDLSKGVFDESRHLNVTDLGSKREIIVDGLGWGRLPKHEVASELKEGRLIQLDHVDQPLVVPIYIGRRAGNDYGKVADALWGMFGF